MSAIPTRKRLKSWTMLLCFWSILLAPLSAAAQAVPNLSLDSLKILVSGVALYPDDFLQLILQAARHPLQIRAAVQGGPTSGAAAPSGPLARLRQAGGGATDPAVEALKAYPDALKALDANLAMTFRLGIAYQNQPNDVWAAVRAVRADVQNKLHASAQAQPAQPSTTTQAAPAAAYGSPYANYGAASAGALAALMVNAYALNELAQAVQSSNPGTSTTYNTYYGSPTATSQPTSTTTTSTTPAGTTTTTTTGGSGNTASGATVTAGTSTTSGGYTTPAGAATTTSQGAGVAVQGQSGAAAAGAGTKTVTGPGGNSATATGAGVAGTYTSGNTTYAGVAGAGTVTTSTGQSVSGAGYAGGSVTQSGDTANWNTQAAGAAQNNNTGATAAATHSGSGQVTQSGSTTSYSRSGSTSAAFPDGTTGNVSKSGSGSVNTTTGTASYTGSSDATTRTGSQASTDTNLTYSKSDGVSGTTTVSKDGQSKTVSYGDGQAAQQTAPTTKSAQRSTGAQPQAGVTAPWQTQAKNGKYSQQDLATATQSHHSNWGNLNKAFSKPAPKSAPHRGGRRG